MRFIEFLPCGIHNPELCNLQCSFSTTELLEPSRKFFLIMLAIQWSRENSSEWTVTWSKSMRRVVEKVPEYTQVWGLHREGIFEDRK